MYLQHFGLAQLPFTLTPNTGFFFGLAPHVEALQVLQTALSTGEGFIKVTGEVGTGKTLVCRKLLNELPKQYHCAYIPNPYLTPVELRWAVANELGIDTPNDVNQQYLAGLIQAKLLELNEQGFNVILVLDEAQSLPDDSIEALRLFTNLETENRKLLQVVLFGQPELDVRLSQIKFRQLRQRITFSYHLRPLSWDEVHAYMQHRLCVAGYQGDNLFSASDAKFIAHAARGIPRLVNIIAHKSLLLSFGDGSEKVKLKHCQDAALDTEDVQLSRTSITQPKRALLWALLAGLLVLSLIQLDATTDLLTRMRALI
ncbi:ExeA family protein [Shewanella intestini]|uniref:AAA family ATPase n=1 Tax=Shewanella intestini TaxID=2017544 RepID=A0ABS5I4W4_9GAMM|nr:MULTISPECIES: AAA family ATPase [Shewanella]MBR9729067.1 AAA family ATPase [Shewanella intestini]MRG37143.1 AAA family ATPase [Shewanella sp. XMDDZSB0408]